MLVMEPMAWGAGRHEAGERLDEGRPLIGEVGTTKDRVATPPGMYHHMPKTKHL